MLNKNHYNLKYFQWQKKAGLYGALIDLWMCLDYIKPSDTVLDFGCGGGYMLDKIKCKDKFGIDINPLARKEAEEKNIQVFKAIEDLPKNLRFNTIISHHVLEHVDSPFQILKSLKIRLINKGYIICVVPIDDWQTQKKFSPGDINKHLYTWTPLLIGNLFTKAGYKLVKIEIVNQAWLPLSRFYYQYIPNVLYKFLSHIWSTVTYSRQIRIVATKN